MTRHHTTRGIATALAAFALLPNLLIGSPVQAAAAEAGSVTLTVKYTGKGDVDKSHQIWTWLFDTPNIGPGAMPIGEMSLDKNGGDVAFTNVTADKVWIAVAYDINGGFSGMAPPPSGSPVAIHSDSSGAPAEVTPGDKTRVSVTFNDTDRMP